MTVDPRRPVWIAMSDLFLDTDVRLSYVHIVRTLAASPYSLDELQRILKDEVTPVLQHNLLQVAGEWAMFPEDWVVAECEKRRNKRRWLPNTVNVDEDWRILAQWITKVRQDARYLEALASLLPLFLSKHCTAQAQNGSRQALQGIYEHDLKPLLLPACRKLWQDSPSTYPSEQEIEDNWRNLPV